MDKQKFLSSWEQLTLSDFSRFANARNQIHQAIQLIASCSRGLYPEIKSDEFANLSWEPELNVFTGRPVGSRWKVRFALDPDTFSLVKLSPVNQVLNRFALDGKTFEEAWDWMKNELEDLDIETEGLNLERPYEIPKYPQANGQPFDFKDQEAFKEVRKFFANGHRWLNFVGSQTTLYLPIRIWPHHFDIATRRRVEYKNGIGHMGVAASPGDHNYDDPYFLFTRYPNLEEKPEKWPEPGNGLEWHTEKWLGLVLPSIRLLEINDREEQGKQLVYMLEEGMKTIASL